MESFLKWHLRWRCTQGLTSKRGELWWASDQSISQLAANARLVQAKDTPPQKCWLGRVSKNLQNGTSLKCRQKKKKTLPHYPVKSTQVQQNWNSGVILPLLHPLALPTHPPTLLRSLVTSAFVCKATRAWLPGSAGNAAQGEFSALAQWSRNIFIWRETD